MPELIDVISANFDYENFFSARLTADMTASDTDIFIDAIPTASEGVLVIDWDVAASREVIFFNSKTASKVTCPSVANGRGFDNTTATTHLSGANVIMAPVRSYFRLAQALATTSEQGWKAVGYAPNTITDNGDGLYTMVFNSVDLTSFLSNGMKIKGTPATAQPTQCASLNGTTQYFQDTTPAGMTFTDDFAVGMWIKPAAYNGTMMSRFNGTNGFLFFLQADGQMYLSGYNAAAPNYNRVVSYNAPVLNRWTHVAAQLDMSSATLGASNNYFMIDGRDVPAQKVTGGTAPTALIQAGNFQIGAYNGATAPFNGKIAQAFITSAKITQDNIRLLRNQGITTADCTTYNIISAYSLSGASGATDLNTTNANNLTAQGSATTTDADSPFGQDDSGTPGTTVWGTVVSAAFSTNTTLKVQAPIGTSWPTLPTSAAVGTLSYSISDTPFGFPKDQGLDRYVQITVAQIFTNTLVDGYGLLTTISLEKATRVKVDVYISAFLSTVNLDIAVFSIYDGSTQIQDGTFTQNGSAASTMLSPSIQWDGWLAAGDHTIKVRCQRVAGTGNCYLSAGIVRPSFIRVTPIY